MLQPSDLIEIRHDLHQHPELSGQEENTARRVTHILSSFQPDILLEQLGGTGVACVFQGAKNGPSILLRCELDALPIQERNDMPYRSTQHGVSHKCGHDGHMAILLAVGSELAIHRPQKGRVILLFQPAEETGAGAKAVIDDPRFVELTPDYAFALHNLPGYDLGEVVLRPGTFCCASRGMSVRLTGATAHAAQPETGRSPAKAMCSFIEQMSNLPFAKTSNEEITLATVVGARLGEKAFGTAPETAEIWMTLRAETDNSMSDLMKFAETTIVKLAELENLKVEVEYEDIFSATVNSSQAVDLVRCAAEGNSIRLLDSPIRWSEDFGKFTALSNGALFGIGAGKTTVDLHNPDYDFPDELIPIASNLLLKLIDQTISI